VLRADERRGAEGAASRAISRSATCASSLPRKSQAGAGRRKSTLKSALVLQQALQPDVQIGLVLRDKSYRSCCSRKQRLPRFGERRSLRRTHPNFACRPWRQLRSPNLTDPRRVLVSCTTKLSAYRCIAKAAKLLVHPLSEAELQK
jgi:hypothetical protein